MENNFDLSRFLCAQEYEYPAALKEIQNGQKQNHWMWYIFPQLRGLGNSGMANHFGIENPEEARCYYEDPILGARLTEITCALLQLPGDNPTAVVGYPDDMKLCSCMTLFSQVAGNGFVFEKVLDKYYAGRRDQRTLQLLEERAKHNHTLLQT